MWLGSCLVLKGNLKGTAGGNTAEGQDGQTWVPLRQVIFRLPAGTVPELTFSDFITCVMTS